MPTIASATASFNSGVASRLSKVLNELVQITTEFKESFLSIGMEEASTEFISSKKLASIEL